MRASAVLMLAGVLTAPCAAAHALVYRVDQAIVRIDGDKVVVFAKGAVRTGGWDRPRLVLHKNRQEPGDLELRFMADPPVDHATVVQSVVPVSVSMKMHLPKTGIAAVKIVAETNAVDAEIIARHDRKLETRR